MPRFIIVLEGVKLMLIKRNILTGDYVMAKVYKLLLKRLYRE